MTDELHSPAGGKAATARSQAPLHRLLALLLVLLVVGAGTVEAEPVAREFQLKAAFLYNFTKFIEWPPRSFASPTSPIVIAVLGRNVFGAELERAVEGRTVNGRAIVVKTIQAIDGARSAQILFLSSAEDGRLEEAKEVCRSAGVLTVGETESFARRGGMITFKLEADKLRFEINVDAAAQSGLKVSAQLQKLAANILRR